MQELEEERAKLEEAQNRLENFKKVLIEQGLDENQIEQLLAKAAGVDAATRTEGVEEDMMIQQKIAELESRNDQLRQSLVKESETRKKSLQMAKKDINKTKNALKEKVGKMQVQSVKSTKKMAVNADKLTKAVKQRDEHLRRYPVFLHIVA